MVAQVRIRTRVKASISQSEKPPTRLARVAFNISIGIKVGQGRLHGLRHQHRDHEGHP